MNITVDSAYLRMTMPDGRPSVGHWLAHLVNPKNNLDPRWLAVFAQYLAFARAYGMPQPAKFTWSPSPR